MDYPSHTPTYHPWSIPPTYPSFPSYAPQDYNAYTSYANSSNPYGYGSSTGYSGYYNSYQQPQPNHAYSQPVGAYQNTGAASYFYHPYTSYAPNFISSYSSGAAATTVQYQQQYTQWADYYNQTAVSCAPAHSPNPNPTNLVKKKSCRIASLLSVKNDKHKRGKRTMNRKRVSEPKTPTTYPTISPSSSPIIFTATTDEIQVGESYQLPAKTMPPLSPLLLNHLIQVVLQIQFGMIV